MSQQPSKPVMLCILDGWGHSDPTEDNAIAHANTPVWDDIVKNYPHGIINASELHVGLPEGQMGNSEVGHMNIGAGRVVMQDLPRIDKAIADGSLAKNAALQQHVNKLKASGGACHLMGLWSPGGVHAHQNHILHLARTIADAGIKVWLHAFTDGRDTPPKSAQEYIETAEKTVSAHPNIAWATITGRYYAMDRDNRWERVQKAYLAMKQAKGENAPTAKEAIEQSYAANTSDEFILPTIIDSFEGMKEGDSLLMANFRADRAREILTALLDPDFTGFDRTCTINFASTLGMVEYSKDLNSYMETIFPPQDLNETLGEVVAAAGLTQLRIAETEKYAHVTFFFNGGKEQEFPGESRILIPSPNVATYDLKPEMSAPEVTDKLIEAIESDSFDLIIVNYANTDMVGHTGNQQAAQKAVEAVDNCLGRLKSALDKTTGTMLITADHGNAEKMHDPQTQSPHTAHTTNLVPFVVVSEHYRQTKVSLPQGCLADIAPTILNLMALPIPESMTGKNLLGTTIATQHDSVA